MTASVRTIQLAREQSWGLRLLISLLMLAGAFATGLYAQVGNVCGTPIVVTALPYDDAGNTSTYGNDYGQADVPPVATDAVTNGTGSNYYLTGFDVVYAYTPSGNQEITISTTNDDDWIGLWAFTGCPFSSTVGYHTAISGATRSIPNLPVLGGTTYYFVISTWDAPPTTNYTIHIELNWAAEPCVGTPAPGATTGPSGACLGVPFTLGVENPSTNSGITYQWETSTDGTTWANAPGTSTASTYATTQSEDTWYRVQVTCDEHSTAISTPLLVTMNAPNECYCIPTGAANNADEIINFTLADLNNTSAPSEGIDGYSDYTGTVPAAQLLAGSTYAASITGGTGSGNHGAAIWIDYNDNGLFEAAERVAFLGNNIPASTATSFPPFMVSAAPGVHRLRVQYTYFQDGGSLDPCVISTTYAETEDYLVEITVPDCVPPEGVNLSNLTDTSVDITWTDNASLSYNYEVRTSGEPGSGPTGLELSGNVASGTPAITLGPLANGTAYMVYVQGVCDGSESAWTMGLGFTPGLVQIGGGAGTNGYFPIYTCYGYNYSQQIYLASEYLGQPYITKIAFKYTGGSTTPANWNNWTVYMGNTTQASFSSTTDWIPLSAMELVYSGPVNPVEGEWMEINLNPGFLWDGTSNMVVAVDENVGGYNCTANWASFGAGSNRGLLYYSDGTNPDPSSPPEANYGPQSSIAQIQFSTGTIPTCLPPTGLGLSNLSASGVDFTWNPSSSDPAGGYSWELHDANDQIVDNGTTNDTNVTISGLEPNTTYSLYVGSDCGAGDLSSTVGTGSFTTPCVAADAPFTEGFESGYADQTGVGGCWSQLSTGGGNAWTANSSMTTYNRQARTGAFNAYLQYGNTDWLFHPINLNAGTVYRFTAYARQDGATAANASLTLAYGNDPTEAGMVNTVVNAQGLVNGDYQVVEGDFSPATTGMYYIGIKGMITSAPWYISLDDISVVSVEVCSGTPDPGATTGPASVCPGVAFMLGIEDQSTYAGISYQWEVSSNGTIWADAPGNSTAATYSTSQTATTWYRLEMTCDGGGTAYSTPLQVTLKGPTECYCTTSFSTVEPICNVTFSDINHDSDPAINGSPGLEDFSSVVAHVQTGSSYVISVTGNTNGNNSNRIVVHFDWNGDGVFDAYSSLGELTNDLCTNVRSATIQVPTNAVLGTSYMRIIKNRTTAPTDPCATYTYGQAEDYSLVVSGPSVVDCEGVVDGPAMPGTPCIATSGFGGTWSNTCVCEENVGITEEAAVQGVAIHPNPATTELFITTPGQAPVHVKVFDMLGKLTMEQDGTTRLDISDLAPGSYNLLITDRQGAIQARARFVKR